MLPDMGNMTENQAAAAVAQAEMSKLYSHWLAKKEGFLAAGMTTKIDGVSFKVISHNDACHGFFLVALLHEGWDSTSPEDGIILQTRTLYHPGTVAYGERAVADLKGTMTSMMDNINEFLADHPEAIPLLKTISDFVK